MNFYLSRKTIRRLPGIVIRAVPLPEPDVGEGFASRAQVGGICRERGYRSVLLVTDKTIYSLGYHERIVRSLAENGVACTVFSDIASEPTVDIVLAGRQAAADCGAECIIALGGGSVLDSSKVIAASAKHCTRNISYYLQKFVFADTLPMITVPSTAGTGAEMTVGAVVKDAKGVKKASVIVGLHVTDVILDSELTENAPEKVTAACGIDALSHGLEGCLADVKVDEEDMHKSRECVRLVMENLPALIEQPHDIERRQKLCLAANYGGNAINKQLAGYVHAFAHTLGAYYHVSHGEAIARCLLPITRFQETICRDKLRALSVYCGCADEQDAAETAVEKLLDRLGQLLEQCGFSGGFPALEEKDYPKLIRGIDADSINYSPAKTLTDGEIVRLLDEIKRGAV